MRSWFDLLYNWPPNSELLLNKSLLELIFFLNNVGLNIGNVQNHFNKNSRMAYDCMNNNIFKN